MKIIYNGHIPFKRFRAINLFGIIFARNDCGKLTPKIINHEKIHTRQIIELLGIGFYVWYALEWGIRLILCRNGYEAYRNIGFEREAYENESDFHYLQHRKVFNFLKYLKKRTG